LTIRHFIILTILLATLLGSCQKRKNNSISISIYKTEDTYKLYKIIYQCDSLTNLLLHKNLVDTNSLSLSEQLELLNSIPNSKDFSIATHPILGRMSNIYHFVTDSTFHNSYKLNSSAIFGKADCVDTFKINNWLTSIDCNAKEQLPFTYKWLVDSDNLEEAMLIGIKSNSPLLTLWHSDLDSIKLTPDKGLLGLIEMFTDEKIEPTSYSLDIVIKQTALHSIRELISVDSTSSYIAIIQSGNFKFHQIINTRDIFITGTLDKITKIDKKDLDDFLNKFDSDILRIE
jgi:hypothetical protein